MDRPLTHEDDPQKPFDWGAGLGAMIFLLWVAFLCWALKTTVPAIWYATIEAFR